MTDIELADSATEVVFRGSDEQFQALLGELEVDELVDVGLVLTKMSGTSAIRAGLTAYEIRRSTPDGEWGKKVYELAETWEVSDRTIHRWMKAAQDHFDLELTPSQKNAAAARPPDVASADDTESPDFIWDDDEEDGSGFPDDLGGGLMDEMNAEAGWGDDTLPSAKYKNEDAPGVTPVKLILEPDETWVAFTAHSIMQEHEGYSEQAAQRSAVARWARKLGEDPLDLLAELEMIYEADGRAVTEDIVDKLYAAEESKPIVPDEVTEGGPKKPRGAKKVRLAYDQAENLLTSTRALHEYCFVGHRDGKVDDKQIAGMLPHLQSLPHAVKGLIKLAEEAKARYLTENPPMEDRIAATQAEEADEDPDY